MTNSTTPARKTRTAASKPKLSATKAVPAAAAGERQPSQLDKVETLLLAPAGATIAELMAATGWQQHSVRGAIAGAIKKRGLLVASEKVDDLRRYRASRPA